MNARTVYANYSKYRLNSSVCWYYVTRPHKFQQINAPQIVVYTENTPTRGLASFAHNGVPWIWG